jgi:hypothetical protein
MKAVGAEIDGGNDFRHSLLLELVFYVIGGDVSRLNGRFSRVIASLSGFRARHRARRRHDAGDI